MHPYYVSGLAQSLCNPVLRAHIIRFLWKLAEEKRSGAKKAAFQTRNRLGLPDVSFCFSEDRADAKIIGIVASRVLPVQTLILIFGYLYPFFNHSQSS